MFDYGNEMFNLTASDLRKRPFLKVCGFKATIKRNEEEYWEETLYWNESTKKHYIVGSGGYNSPWMEVADTPTKILYWNKHGRLHIDRTMLVEYGWCPGRRIYQVTTDEMKQWRQENVKKIGDGTCRISVVRRTKSSRPVKTKTKSKK